ncbi:helix-turn-helix domain-containing protein [Streptomyces sp. NPDC102340]|uniref:helix-turn-helix domain-containing protein n=1 Tax=unclassified Streptomyces TaxID=2593676 RepID=UPI0037F62764
MASEPRYVLIRPEVLRLLMERTGSGAAISGRELAAAVGVPHGTINSLLKGITRSQPHDIARKICAEIGVDLLCLWTPRGRSARTDEAAPSELVAA